MSIKRRLRHCKKQRNNSDKAAISSHNNAIKRDKWGIPAIAHQEQNYKSVIVQSSIKSEVITSPASLLVIVMLWSPTSIIYRNSSISR